MKDALMFVKQKLDSAKWFIDAYQTASEYTSPDDECNSGIPG